MKKTNEFIKKLKNAYVIENEELGYGILNISFPILYDNKLIFTLYITTNIKVLDMNFKNIRNNVEKFLNKIIDLY